METLEVIKEKSINPNRYMDINKSVRIPALDRAIAELKAGEYTTSYSFEEYLEEMYSDDDE